jgi:hypothetical protein
MSIKSTLIWGLKYIVLTLLYLVTFIISGVLLDPGVSSPTTPDQQGVLMMGISLMALVNTAVTMVLILRSTWSGWKLMLAVGFSFYGVSTFLSVIEAIYFAPALGIPSDDFAGLFLAGIPTMLIFIPLAVIILGKGWRTTDAEPNSRLMMPVIQWLWKLSAIAVIYPVIYSLFGFFIAWQNPNLVDMYDGGTNPEVFNAGRLIALQMFRSLLWVLFAVPIIKMTRGKTWQVAVLVGLLYSLPMAISLVLPNPYMPDASARLSHFIEITLSNFLFGWIVTYLLLWRPGHTSQAANTSIQSQIT